MALEVTGRIGRQTPLSELRRPRVTRFDVRTLPSGLARDLDVDRVHTILVSAERGQLSDLFALYRDIIATNAHLQGRFSDRKRAVIGDTLTIQPADKKVLDDVAAADAVREMIEGCVEWEDALVHLLDSTLYPVAVLEKVYRPEGNRFALDELVRVEHDLLDWGEGKLRIRATDEQGRPNGQFFELDPAHYIVARVHTLTLPDQWGGPLRALVFWWLLATMDREWWGRFLDKYGTPFMVGKYDQADDQSRSILERAFSLCTKLGGLVVSRETEIEIKEAARSDAGGAYETFIRFCHEEISKLIVGQTLSSDAKATGMGSGVAKSQSATRDDIRQADARRLAHVLRHQLVAQFMAANGIRGRLPKLIFGQASTEETEVTGALLSSLATANLELTDDGVEALSERVGLPLQRVSAPKLPSAPFSVRAYAADAPDTGDGQILRGATAALARSLGADFAPIAQLILASRSPADAIARVETFCAEYRPTRSAKILEEVMLAMTANGAASHAR
jgi:phage gp29-like protein